MLWEAGRSPVGSEHAEEVLRVSGLRGWLLWRREQRGPMPRDGMVLGASDVLLLTGRMWSVQRWLGGVCLSLGSGVSSPSQSHGASKASWCFWG